MIIEGGFYMPAPNRNNHADFVTVKIAMQEMNLCRSSVVNLAREAGALIRYGNCQRININKLKSYFIKEYTE